jgi:DNA polymerase delta subunit 3
MLNWRRVLDQVNRVSRPKPAEMDEVEGSDHDEDVDMAETSEPIPKPQRKKKVKKVIPVGKNGLKKRRVVKSRMMIDDKGYTGWFLICLTSVVVRK